MNRLHRYILIASLIMATGFSIHGCTKSTDTPVNDATDSTAVSASSTPRSVEVIMDEGWTNCDNDYQDPEGINFYGKLDPDSNAIELLKTCNSSHVDLKKLEKLISKGVDLNKTYQVGSHQFTPLGVLCSRSDIDEEALRFLIKHGANINQPGEDGDTPLMIACDRRNIDKPALKLLIELGADVNAGDKDDDPAIMVALNRACYDKGAVKMLLNAGSDVQRIDKDGAGLIHLSIRDPDIAKQIIDMGASVYSQSNSGHDALFTASWAGLPESVSMMISKGMDVNRILPSGFTPLINAALGNKLDVIKLLEEAGADLFYKTDDGTNLLSYACQRNKKQKQYVRAPKVQTDVIQYLMEKGLDVHSADDDGFTPLMYLVLADDDVSDAVKLLLDAGADINHMSKNGYSPIMLVHNPNVARLLIERGADIHASNEGYNALFAAVSHDKLEIVKILLDKGLDPNATTEWGETPLMYAESVEVAKYLMEHGAVLRDNTHKKYKKAFMTSYFDRHIDEVWLSRTWGSESPRYKTVQISDEDLRKKSYLILYYLEKGANTDERSLPFQALEETLIFDNDEDYKKLFDLYINKNTVSSRRGSPSILQETLSSTEFRGIKLTPDISSVQKYIEMKGSVDNDEILAYFKNDKVTIDTKIVNMLMSAKANKDELLYNYLRNNYYHEQCIESRDSRVIPLILDSNTALNGYELYYYLKCYSNNPNMEIVKKLVKALLADKNTRNEVLTDYLDDDNLIPQNQIIRVMLDNGAVADDNSLTYYFERVQDPDIEIIKKLLAAGDDPDTALHYYLANDHITPQNDIIKVLLDAEVPMRGDELGKYLVNPNVKFDKDIAMKIFYSSDRLYPTAERYVDNCKEEIHLMILVAEKLPELLPEFKRYANDPDARVTRYCKYHEETLLMKVVSDPDLVQILINAGADVNAVTSDGKTALSRAIKGGFTKSAELLRNAGAVEHVTHSESH